STTRTKLEGGAMVQQSDDPLTRSIIGAAIEVHKALGPGLLESAYEVCLAHELRLAGHVVVAQRPLPIEYRGLQIDCAYRLDLVVDESAIIEVKAVEKLLPIHEAQLLTYLRLTGLRTGLLLNFHVPYLRDGIKRLVL